MSRRDPEDEPMFDVCGSPEEAAADHQMRLELFAGTEIGASLKAGTPAAKRAAFFANILIEDIAIVGARDALRGDGLGNCTESLCHVAVDLAVSLEIKNPGAMIREALEQTHVRAGAIEAAVRTAAFFAVSKGGGIAAVDAAVRNACRRIHAELPPTQNRSMVALHFGDAYEREEMANWSKLLSAVAKKATHRGAPHRGR